MSSEAFALSAACTDWNTIGTTTLDSFNQRLSNSAGTFNAGETLRVTLVAGSGGASYQVDYNDPNNSTYNWNSGQLLLTGRASATETVTIAATTNLGQATVTHVAGDSLSVSTSCSQSNDGVQKSAGMRRNFIGDRANQIVNAQPTLVNRLSGTRTTAARTRNSLNINVTPEMAFGDFRFSLQAFLKYQEAIRKARSNTSSANQAAAPAEQQNVGTARNSNEDAQPGQLSDQDQTIYGQDPSALAYGEQPARSGMAPSGTFAGAPAGAPMGGPQDPTSLLLATNGSTVAALSAARSTGRTGLDIWTEGNFARTTNANMETLTGLFYAGMDYAFSDQSLIGVMMELDISDSDNDMAGTSARGTGWMVGPYMVIRLHQNLFLDAVATAGRSYNRVEATGAATDDFRTDRFLIQSGLTGDFRAGRFTFNPFARLTYYWEKQDGFSSLAGTGSSTQAIDLGRLEFGPTVKLSLPSTEALNVALNLGLSGLYDFNTLQDQASAGPMFATASENFRAKLSGGAEVRLGGKGLQLSGEGFYDGIGVEDFSSIGGRMSVRLAF